MLPTRWIGQYVLPRQHIELIAQLTKRQIQQRFKGSILGAAWVFITPILMLCVYTFVFKSVLKAKWPGNEDANNMEFALQIFSGLLIFGLFAEVLSRAATLITDQPNMVKKIIFPLPILAWVNVLSALFFAAVNLAVLVIGAFIMRMELSWHIISVIVLCLACTPMLLGLSWGLAALGVYLRDLTQVIGLILTPLMFLSPIFYPITALPELLQKIMVFNPLVMPIEVLREAVLIGQWPNWLGIAIYLLLSSLIMIVGAAGFHKLKKGFADVL